MKLKIANTENLSRFILFLKLNNNKNTKMEKVKDKVFLKNKEANRIISIDNTNNIIFIAFLSSLNAIKESKNRETKNIS
jgi:hypothetical protein